MLPEIDKTTYGIKGINYGNLATRLFLIDLKGTEFGEFKHLRSVVNVATNFDDAIATVKFFYDTMMERQAQLKEKNFNEVPTTAEGDKEFPALILIIDEAAQMFSEIPMNQMRQANEAMTYLEKIGSLGRAFHVQYFIFTQSNNPAVFPSGLKNNTQNRLIYGRIEDKVSLGWINNANGSAITNIPGSSLLYSVKSDITTFFRGYFMSRDDIFNNVPLLSDEEYNQIYGVKEVDEGNENEEKDDKSSKETNLFDDIGLFKNISDEKLDKEKSMIKSDKNRDNFEIKAKIKEVS